MDAGLLGDAPDAAGPPMTVELVQAPGRMSPVAAPSPDRPSSRTASVVEPAGAPPSPPAMTPPAGPPSLSAPTDDDPLIRAPFRDAVAQASAELRAGLGCAHVDLLQLPKTLLDLCAAASRHDGAAQVAEAGPSQPP